MQQHVFNGWDGNRRFVIAVVALVVILLVTLGAAIFSYINAYTTMTTLGVVKVTQSPSAVTSIESTSSTVTSTPSVSETIITQSSESEAEVKATITTSSDASVVINGTPVEMPESGTLQQEVPTEDGKATLNVQLNTDNSESSDSRSKLKIKMESSTEYRSEHE